MATIILQTMPATESNGMVFQKIGVPCIELQQAATIQEAAIIARAMIQRAKDAGKGASIAAVAYGRKPNGWNAAKYSILALNTFQ